MINQTLEENLPYLSSNGVIKIETGCTESFKYHIDINAYLYAYDSINDLVLDCIELSRRFELVFV